MAEVVLESTLTCPHCGHVCTEIMPRDTSQWFYLCRSCHQVLRPKPGFCCVFCSYGTMQCPPIQEFVTEYIESWTRKSPPQRICASPAFDATVV